MLAFISFQNRKVHLSKITSVLIEAGDKMCISKAPYVTIRVLVIGFEIHEMSELLIKAFNRQFLISYAR